MVYNRLCDWNYGIEAAELLEHYLVGIKMLWGCYCGCCYGCGAAVATKLPSSKFSLEKEFECWRNGTNCWTSRIKTFLCFFLSTSSGSHLRLSRSFSVYWLSLLLSWREIKGNRSSSELWIFFFLWLQGFQLISLKCIFFREMAAGGEGEFLSLFSPIFRVQGEGKTDLLLKKIEPKMSISISLCCGVSTRRL